MGYTTSEMANFIGFLVHYIKDKAIEKERWLRYKVLGLKPELKEPITKSTLYLYSKSGKLTKKMEIEREQED